MNNTPKLRFKEFSNLLKSIKIKDILLSNTYGPRFNGNDYDLNGNVKTIRGTDIGLNGEIKYNQVPLAKLDNKFIQNHILEDGDLVMITTADCGLTGLFKQQDIDYIPSAYAVKIRLNKNNIPLYFKYFFQTTIAKNEINKYIRKATVANLPASDIVRIKIHLPKKQEQQKIASFLTSVDSKIEQLSKKQNLLEEYKKGIMQKIFSQEIRFRDDDGGEFGDWEEKKLGDIAIFSKGKGISKADIVEDGIFECIRYGELYTIYNETITTIKSKTNLNKNELILSKFNDIIIPASGETQIDIATASCILKDNVALSGDLNIIRTKENGVFLAYYLNSSKKIDIARLSQGISVVHLYSSQLKLLKLNLPPLKEQTKIANFLSSIDKKIEFISNQLAETKEFKKGLLQKMFV